MTTITESDSFSSDSKVMVQLDRAIRVRLKQVAQLNPGRSEASQLRSDDSVTFLPMEAVGTDGLPRYHESVLASIVWKGFTYFRRGDILLAKITPCFENGKTALLDRMPTEIGFGSTEFHVLRSGPQILPEYLHHVIRTHDFRRKGEDQMTGAAGQQRIPTDFVAEYQFRLPPLAEQRAIARFLDRKSRRIARFIHARQRMIALLNEQKQAIIHQAVTRGLDPDVPLKPSGIDSLGDIPAHWKTFRLQQLISKIEQGWSPQCEAEPAEQDEWGVLKVGSVNSEQFRPAQNKKLQSSFSPRENIRVRKGDIVMSRANTPQLVGLAALVDSDEYKLMLSDKHYRFRALEDKTDKVFLVAAIRDPVSRAQIVSKTSGASSSMQNISQAIVREIVLAVPPLLDQREILDQLQNELSRTSTTLSRLGREIELLREYRTRLIADVVTDQLDIRDHPDAAEDAPDDLDELSEIESALGTMDGIEADPDDLDDALPQEDSSADAD